MSRFRSNTQSQIIMLQSDLRDVKERLMRNEERHVEVLKELAAFHKNLQERVLVLETNYEHVSKSLIQIQKETSLTARLLVGIVMAVVSAGVTFLLKYYFNLF